MPTIASIKIGSLKSQVYGVRKIEISENTHMENNDKIFALNGIAPVFKNCNGGMSEASPTAEFHPQQTTLR